MYDGWTNHGHGAKYVQLYNFNTNTVKCDDYETGSTDAACSVNATSTYIGSYHDTGAAGGCDKFSDGHGICAHDMEPHP